MLFMPMMPAAARAALRCGASRCAAATASISRLKDALREAMAAASATDQIWPSLSPGAPLLVSTLPRLSFRSRAYSGIASRIASRLVMGILRGALGTPLMVFLRGALSAPLTDFSAACSGSLQCLVALLPVAWAQFVRLQRIQYAQHLVRVTPDAEVRYVDKANDTLWVNDVGGPLRDAGFRIENAERARQLTLDVRQHRERKLAQLFLLLAPGEMHELAVDAHA